MVLQLASLIFEFTLFYFKLPLMVIINIKSYKIHIFLVNIVVANKEGNRAWRTALNHLSVTKMEQMFFL